MMPAARCFPSEDMPLFSRLADKRLIAVVAVVLVLAGLHLAGLGKVLSFDTLRTHRTWLTAWVAAHGPWAVATYLCLYVAIVALSVPGAALLTLTGGFLFGAASATGLAVAAATAGAGLVFIFARQLFGADAMARAGPRAAALAGAIRANAWPYLLALRLVPLFPFFLVNLVPAFAGVRLSTFLLTTLVGIIPTTFVFALAGAGLGRVLDEGDGFSVAGVLTPEIWAGLLGLAALSLLAVPLRRRLARSRQADPGEAANEPM